MNVDKDKALLRWLISFSAPLTGLTTPEFSPYRRFSSLLSKQSLAFMVVRTYLAAGYESTHDALQSVRNSRHTGVDCANSAAELLYVGYTKWIITRRRVSRFHDWKNLPSNRFWFHARCVRTCVVWPTYRSWLRYCCNWTAVCQPDYTDYNASYSLSPSWL